MKHLPTLSVTRISWRGTIRRYGNIECKKFDGVMIKSGDDIYFFRNAGYISGRRYINRGQIAYMFCGDEFVHEDWWPVNPDRITSETLDSVCRPIQGPVALEFIQDMVIGTPAIHGCLKKIICRYGGV